MIKTLPEQPFYIRLAVILLALYLLLYGIYIGQSIILPIAFSFLFAVLLQPIVNFFIRRKFPKVLSIIVTLVLAILFIYVLISFISYQMRSVVSDIPAVKNNLLNLWHQCQQWLWNTFKLNYAKQEEMVQNAKDKTMDTLGSAGTFNLITASIATILLVPIYIFLFLFYRPLLINFIVDVFDKTHEKEVRVIVSEIRKVVQHYVIGIMTETSIVACLNVTGLLILGAPYAILLGVVGAILNMIPYIGGIIQLLLTALIVFSNTASIGKATGAIVILLAVQLIDNNFLVPRIIGSRVKLNALISIIGVFVGGALCGIGGMFLSIPVLAMCKVIFDRVDGLKPWGRLFGSDM
ncbi:MAG: family transporter [Chitinophagaceae bacterium]|nr:family transporter [Chitinophagaceae bacterium]